LPAPSHSKISSNMPHVTFGEGSPVKKTYEEKRTIIKIPAKTDDEPKKVVRQRSRTIAYKIPDETRKTKPAEKLCIERKITYKDLDGNVVKIVYEDECGKVIRTIYPAVPPPKCSPPPPKCSSPPVSEPSNIPSEDVRDCNWTKIVVKNSRGVVWKIVHVDCDGKTMKTEYPEREPSKRRSVETRRYVVKALDDGPSRRVVIQKESCESVPSQSSETNSTKESDAQSSQKSGTDSTTTRRDSANSSGGRKSFESAEEIVKDENGVTKRVTYTDSRGRRRTVVYDD
jgi:uncharacterized lipoprotein YehR (DUF1307 family)